MKRFSLPLAALVLASLPATVAAQQGPRIVHQPSERPFSGAVQVGNTYWLSGKIGATAETASMEGGRVAAETHNIMRAFGDLLGELGLDYGDLVRATVYLADIDDYAEMRAAHAEDRPPRYRGS